MKKRVFMGLLKKNMILCLFVAGFLSGATNGVNAGDGGSSASGVETISQHHKNLTFENCVFRSLRGAKAASAYLTIKNTGKTHDKLVDVIFTKTLANNAVLHTHKEKNGIMKMVKVDFIPANVGTPAVLKQGGDHIMLLGVNDKIHDKKSITISLVFEHAGKVDVVFNRKNDGGSCGCCAKAKAEEKAKAETAAKTSAKSVQKAS